MEITRNILANDEDSMDSLALSDLDLDLSFLDDGWNSKGHDTTMDDPVDVLLESSLDELDALLQMDNKAKKGDILSYSDVFGDHDDAMLMDLFL